MRSQNSIAILFAVILFSGVVPSGFAQPSSAPQNLITTPLDTSSILASWGEPAKDGGQNVTTYRLEY